MIRARRRTEGVIHICPRVGMQRALHSVDCSLARCGGEPRSNLTLLDNAPPAGRPARIGARVGKTGPGPDAGGRPRGNPAGMTANPAGSDDVLSPKTVHSAGRARFSFASRYEP